MAEHHQGEGIQKNLKFIYVYAIATGAIFTFVGYWDTVFVSYCGPATFLAFALMTLCILPIAFVYCELAPMFPQAGAELIYNTVSINKHVGFFSAWMIMLAWIAVPPAAIMAIVEWINKVGNFNMSIQTIMWIGMGLLVIYCCLSLLNIQIAGKVQLVMLVLAVAGCLITSVSLLCHPNWSWANFTPFFQSSLGDGAFGGWLIGLGLIITPFFGFETVPELVEDADFPIQDSTKAIWGSVVTCGVVYTLLFFAIGGIAPYHDLLFRPDGTEVSFLTITAMENLLGWKVWPLLYGIAAIICAIGTCLLGFWISTVRLLYAMGRQNFLPAVFSKCNRFGQPILPNIFLLLISFAFLLMQNTGTFMKDFFNLMAFGCAVTYAITMIGAMRLRKIHPEWVSPYKLPGGQFTRVLALILCIVIAFATTIGQGVGSWRSFGVYIAIGVVLWITMLVRWKKSPVTIITPGGEVDY